jgi:beta-lactamase superfamily II metal-dependent hydrolase
MRIRVYQSDKGDCLLVSATKQGKTFNVLVDGGMKDSFSEHVAPDLGKLRGLGQKLDAVYVSHIDQDHISGVLQLFDDIKDWRVHEFQKKNGNPKHKPPEAPLPPDVGVVWHNSFHEQLKDNAGAIEDMLAATASILAASNDPVTQQLAADVQDLATSKAEAIQLSRRIGRKQLNIPLNPEFDGALMCIKDGMPAPIAIGPFTFTVIGPAAGDLDALRDEWNEWLRLAKTKTQLRNIRKRARADERDLLDVEAGELRELLHEEAEELREDLGRIVGADLAAAFRLGVRDKVTVPNLASLMFLLEEGNKTVLLTGDGHSDDVLAGLRHQQRLAANGGLHVNVLKVQHHGSEHNLDEAFCRTITADHYVFCGNGEHENPDLRVVDAILDSRLGPAAKKSQNPEVGHEFTLWFNSSEAVTPEKKAKAYMKKLRRRVDERRAEHPVFEAHFLEGGSFFDIEP